MRTSELVEHLIRLANKLGYQVRMEPFGGQGGGVCELRGRRMLFLDEDLLMEERLDVLVDALVNDPRHEEIYLPPEVRELLERAQATADSLIKKRMKP